MSVVGFIILFHDKNNQIIKIESISLSLSKRSPLFCWVISYVCGRLPTPSFYHFFGVGLPAFLSNHSLFSREHIFLGCNEFPSLVYWYIVFHYNRPNQPTLFRRVRWDFTCVQCDVCTETGPLVFSPIRED